MFTLLTGLPGSSKSLQTIKLVEKERVLLGADGSRTVRPVYYWGIPDLTLDWIPLCAPDSTPEEARARYNAGLKECRPEDAYTWFEVPPGSIVVIDECQFVFAPLPQKARSNPPPHLAQLAIHRHSGTDLYCMTQHPSLIAIEARRQVQRHWHLERPFGLDYANALQWEKCQSPDDRAARNQANVVKLSLDKSVFGLYRSAEVHTVKKRIPWAKIGVAVGGLVAVVALFVFAFHRVRTSNEAKAAKNDKQTSVASADRPAGASRVMTMEALTPRVNQWPWSGPFYDQVAKVQSYPRVTGCLEIAFASGEHWCKCSNGQGGDAQVDTLQCHNYMAGRYFDPTKPQEDAKGDNIRRLEMADGSGGGRSPLDEQPRSRAASE